jgi:hypothetical protein
MPRPMRPGWFAPRALLTATLALARLGAAEADPDASGVSDPYGLGERLALIDYLQAQHQRVEPGTDLPTLRRRYQAQVARAQVEAATQARDQAALELWRIYGENATPEATLADITARIAKLRADAELSDQAEHAREAADAAAAEERAPVHVAPAAMPPPMPAAMRQWQQQIVGAAVREVARPPDLGPGGLVELISPDKSPILLVVMSQDLFGRLERPLAAWKPEVRLGAGVDGTVIILGHSDGMHFAQGAVGSGGDLRGELAVHLSRNRDYYETMAGTRAAKPVDLAAMCGCNASGADQEAQLRDGFGYRPLHRVFTVPGRLDRTDMVTLAIICAGSTPVDVTAAFQARFDAPTSPAEREIGCYAVVGADALQLQSPMHVFELKDRQLTELPAP